MPEQIYGFVTGCWHKHNPVEQVVDGYIESIVREGVDGIYLTTLTFGDDVQLLARRVAEVGKELIIGFQVQYPMNKADITRIGEAMRWTRRLALGNVLDGEFCSLGGPRRGMVSNEISSKLLASRCYTYLEDAERYGYQWVCCLTHRCLLVDMNGGQRARAVLAKSGTLVTPLCAYIIAGYLHGDSRVPDQGVTSTAGLNLHRRFGVTGDAMRDYCKPLNIISGAGGQIGLDAGTRRYMRGLGFKGLVAGLPFTLTGSDTARTYPELDSYPLACGGFDTGYRRETP
ncbi:MAG TPA: hypothetical protein VMV98_08115 [Acidobacteriaceae bacterium]|nr:hypothetical protein [Acidobacteriaceae bacterium]